MKHRAWGGIVLASSAALWLESCGSLPSLSEFTSFGRAKSSGVERVDELLSKVEQLQVETAVSKERAHAALTSLLGVAGSDFSGDPAAAHAQLAQRAAQSSEQGKQLAASIAPMKELANEVFEAWTADLEKFGAASMRKHSQTRLEETRARYDEIVARAVAAQISYDSFNRAVKDHVLFLEHDFNAAAVEVLAPELEGLADQALELDRRFVACIESADAYVKGATLRGQSELPAAEARAATPAEAPPTTLSRRKVVTTKPPVATASALPPAVPAQQP